MYRGGSEGGATAPPCDACGRPKPPTVAICPHCAGRGNAFRELSEEVAEQAKKDGSSWRHATWPGWLRAILFALAFPVTVPSLALHWLFARRWGRVPYVFVFVDGVVVVFLCLGSPVLLTVAVVAFASAIVLLFRFAWQGRTDSGIFLGYSNHTVLPLIFGGVALVAGFFLGVPSSYYRRASWTTTGATDVRLAEIEGYGVPVPKHVRVVDASADWNASSTGQLGGVTSARFAPISAPRKGANGNAPVLVAVTSTDAPPREALDGMLVTAPPAVFDALTGPPTAMGKLRDVYLLVLDPAFYPVLGLVPPDEPIAWHYMAIAAIGAVLLSVATWRSIDESA